MWRYEPSPQIRHRFNSPALHMKRKLIYEKPFNFIIWFIRMRVITIHQVKSLPTASVSILISEFGYATISLDYSTLPWNMDLKMCLFLCCYSNYFVKCCAVGGNTLNAYRQRYSEYLKVAETERSWDSQQLNGSRAEREQRIIYLSNRCVYSSFIYYHSKQLMFSLCQQQFLCNDKSQLIQENKRMNWLNPLFSL